MKHEMMKPSGVAWLGDIPSTWDCKKIGSLFKQRNIKVSDKDYPALSVSKAGVTPQLDTAVKTDNGDNRKLVKAGDFVINSRSDRKGSCGISSLDGSVSLIYIVLTPQENWNGRYVHYLMRSQPFLEEYYHYGRGIVADLWTTRYSEMKNICIPVPPREEQDQIVRYLDWQVSKINKLIAAKKKQIALSKERSQVLVSDLVIHGLSKDAVAEESGVEWIGIIPSNWEVLRCKYLFTERDERSKDGSETHLSMSQKFGLIPDSEFDERRMLSTSYAGGKLCYENDLVLNRLKAHLGVFALAPQLGVISPDYTVLIPNTKRIVPQYAEALLKSDLCRRELCIRVRGIIEGFWRLYTDDFYTIKLPVPSIDEQKEIMAQVSVIQRQAKAFEAAIQKEIDVLSEMRNRLISDVVTGQIDVRGIEIPEYEYVADSSDEEESEADEEVTELVQDE